MMLSTDPNKLAMLGVVFILALIILLLRYISLIVNPSLVATHSVQVLISIIVPLILIAIICQSILITALLSLIAVITITSFIFLHGVIKDGESCQNRGN